MSEFGSGCKVFYFFPEGHYHTKIIGAVIDQEYEIYTTSRGAAGIKAAAAYRNIVVCVNMCTSLTEELSQFLTEVEAQKQKLIEQNALVVPLFTKRVEAADWQAPFCKPIFFPQDPDKGVALFLSFLDEMKVKGQRRYVRFGGNDTAIAPMRIQSGGKVYHGTLSDISSAGISFSLEGGTVLAAGKRIDSFSIEIGKALSNLKGTVTLRRKLPDGSILLVAMFDAPEPKAREAIQRYIHTSLQKQFSARMEIFMP
jgi:hypothetical protein